MRALVEVIDFEEDQPDLRPRTSQSRALRAGHWRGKSRRTTAIVLTIRSTASWPNAATPGRHNCGTGSKVLAKLVIERANLFGLAGHCRSRLIGLMMTQARLRRKTWLRHRLRESQAKRRSLREGVVRGSALQLWYSPGQRTTGRWGTTGRGTSATAQRSAVADSPAIAARTGDLPWRSAPLPTRFATARLL